MTNSMAAVMIRATRHALGLPEAVDVTAKEIAEGRFDIRLPLASAQYAGVVAWAGSGARDRDSELQAREHAGRLAAAVTGSPVTFGEAAMLSRRSWNGQRVSIIANVDYPEQVRQDDPKRGQGH